MSVLVQTVQTSNYKSVDCLLMTFVGWLSQSIFTQKACAHQSARHAVAVECVQHLCNTSIYKVYSTWWCKNVSCNLFHNFFGFLQRPNNSENKNCQAVARIMSFAQITCFQSDKFSSMLHSERDCYYHCTLKASLLKAENYEP